MKPSNPLLWTGLFSLLFLLALDYWRWESVLELGWMGFPSWMGYFMVLQVILTIMIGLFAKYGWKDRSAENSND